MPAEDEPGHEDPNEDGRALRAQRRRRERREAIIEAAKIVFRERGYHPASVNDIIAQAEIARGTFYLYFTNKQDIFQELIEDFLADIRGQVRRISTAPDSPPPIEQLRQNLLRIMGVVLANEGIAAVILRDPASFDDESGAHVEQFFAQVQQLTEDALTVGQTLGLVRPCNNHIVAVTALGGVREVLAGMLDARVRNDRESDLASPEHVAEELIAFVLRAVGREGLVGA